MPDDFDYSKPRTTRAGSVDHPIITLLLMVLSTVMTAAYLFAGATKGTPLYVLGHMGHATIFQIWNGRYWALVSSVFVHANIAHIFFNMYWVWMLGKAIETSIHPLAYLAFIVSSAAVGSGIQILISSDTGIGMSGVVYAMFGLMWAGKGAFGSWRNIATRDNLNIFIGWGVLCIITTYTGIMNVANGAHFGGLLFGLCVGYLWYAPRKRMVMAVPLTALGIVTVLSATWCPWNKDYELWSLARQAGPDAVRIMTSDDPQSLIPVIPEPPTGPGSGGSSEQEQTAPAEKN